MSKTKPIDHGLEITKRFIITMDEIVGSTKFNKITASAFGEVVQKRQTLIQGTMARNSPRRKTATPAPPWL